MGRLDNSGDARSDSFVDFLVNAPIAGDYDFSIRYANGTGTDSTQGLAFDGGAFQTVTYPATAGWGQFASVIGPTLHLTQGYNVIRLAKGSPFFAGGTGFAELDSITIKSRSSVPAPATPADAPVATFVTRVEAETSTVSDGQKLTSANASGGGYVGTLNNADSYVDFPVTVPADGTYKLTVGYANGGNNNGFNQNGTSDAVLALGANGGAATNVTFPVSGDWGGLGGRFPALSTTVALKAGDTSATRTTTVKITADPATKVTPNVKTIAHGGYVTFSLAGYHRYSAVAITLGSATLGTVTTDVNGNAKVTLLIPVITAAGTYAVTATEQGSGMLTSTTTLKVS